MKNTLHLFWGFIVIFVISSLMLGFVSLNPLSQFLFAFATLGSLIGLFLCFLLISADASSDNQQKKSEQE